MLRRPSHPNYQATLLGTTVETREVEELSIVRAATAQGVGTDSELYRFHYATS